MADLVYNLLLAPVSLGAVQCVHMRPTWPVAVGVMVAHQTLAAALAVGISILLGRGSFGAMGCYDWGLFLHAPLVLGGAGLAALGRSRLLGRAGLAGAALGLGVWAWSHWIEPHWLEVTRVELRSADLTTPVRIVFLADVQTDHVGAFERRVFATAAAAEPDLVILSGDYVQTAGIAEEREQRARFREAWLASGLADVPGVAVRGDVDRPGWDRMFAGSAVTCLTRTDSVLMGELRVTGLTSHESMMHWIPWPEADGFHLIVGHHPDFALGRTRADLVLAGHTHGGQVRLPFFGPPIFFSGVPRAWTSGEPFALADGGTMIVSRGIGMERIHAPRLRFDCRPQLHVIDLLPEVAGE